jgi:hypothetical protein
MSHRARQSVSKGDNQVAEGTTVHATLVPTRVICNVGPMKLRRPTDKLAGCVWLPRFIDKARHHQAGTLHPDFVRPFCHPLATDGLFLAHFELGKDEIIQVIAESNGSDESVAEWFQSRAQYTPEKVAAWNELAPNIGKDGYPAHRGFLWILKQYYGGVAPDPRVDSAFTAIAFDEGYLDEVQP